MAFDESNHQAYDQRDHQHRNDAVQHADGHAQLLVETLFGILRTFRAFAVPSGNNSFILICHAGHTPLITS